ncbi:MAG: hypothetical protein COA50_04535 [Flavobacteriaceae bacterium]|nr:MAG: hypothetical protein COA50_04535 [Flavobacteriaceae bacterium]
MLLLKYYIGNIVRAIKNRIFYLRKGKFIRDFFNEYGYKKTKPFIIHKWHHNLFLFTAIDKMNAPVFIKLTNLPRILKNENRAYKKLLKNDFLKNHVIEYKEYIKKGNHKALVLKKSGGTVLSEDWMVENIDQLHTLIKIVDELALSSLVHRDIKADNFIFEAGNIKIFDFSFMIEKSEKGKIKEINLKSHSNMLKLIDLGVNYKPEPLKWDDYYSLFILFKKLKKNKQNSLSKEQKNILIALIEECKEKVNTNTYTIIK